MAELEKLKKQIKLEIQSLLCTEKAAIPSYQLHKQYRSEMGSHIPYMKLGFQQLDDYLRSISDVVSSYTIEGVLHVKAVPLEASSHINELVHGQKKSKKKKATNFVTNNWAGRFKTFRVSSSVAPNRYFNKNYISFKGDHCNRGYSRPAFNGNYMNTTPFRSQGLFDVRSQLIPQVMQPMKPTQPSQNVEQCSPPVVIKKPFVWKPVSLPVAPTPSGVSQNKNVNNTPYKTMIGSDSSKPSNLQQSQNDRAHLKPQIMQPRVATQITPVKEPVQEDRPNLQPQIMRPRPPPVVNETVINKPQVIQEDRPKMQPEIMQPRPPETIVNKSQLIQEDRPNFKTQIMQPRLVQEQIVNKCPVQENLQFQIMQPRPSQDNFISPPPLDRNFPISHWNPNESVSQQFNRSTDVFLTPNDSRSSSISPPWSQPSAQRPSRPSSPSDFLEGPRRVPSQVTTDLLREQMTKIVISNYEPAVRHRNRPPELVLAPEALSKPVLLPHRAPRVMTNPLVSPVYSSTPPVAGTLYLDTPSPESKPGEMYVERLKRLVDKYKLGRVSCTSSQMKNGNYIAMMKVGLENFQTYPEEFAQLNDANEYAAQMACHHIESTYPI